MHNVDTYRKPFLKEVIVRIDFSTTIIRQNKIEPTLEKKALERFPISEPRKVLSQELQLSHDQMKHTRQDYVEWNYLGKNGEKRLAIAPEYVYVTYSKYESFDSLKCDFGSVLQELYRIYPDLYGKRLGLRYINAIELNERDPFCWDDLIDEDLLLLFKRFRDKKNSTTRLFNIVELKYNDDMQVNFQFGAPNPDYPAPIRRPYYVLDIDAYYQGLIEIQNISRFLENAHSTVQELFEQSIKDELRRIMNER